MKERFSFKLFLSTGAVQLCYSDVDNLLDAFSFALEKFKETEGLYLVEVYDMKDYFTTGFKKLVSSIYKPNDSY